MFSQEENQETKALEQQDNLIAFFDLLLKIDMRMNPELYTPQQHDDD